jgi:hypothetical protein
MAQDNDPRACVDVWVERAAKGLPAGLLLQAFQKAFDTLWRRAQLTLGDVTLMAIVDRVLYNAAERFPELVLLTVEPDGLRTLALRDRADCVNVDELLEGIRFVLVEFLTVLGSLTAEILTRVLYAELVKLAQEEAKP